MNNISQANIKIHDPHHIDIVIQREPKNTTIEQLKARITQLEQLGLSYDGVDLIIAERLETMDITTKAYLAQVLSTYSTKTELESLTTRMYDLIAAEREWNDRTYLKKVYITQAQYDALSPSERKENTIYAII